MHFSERPGSVRVEFYKASGKWYTTEAVDMTAFYREPYPEVALAKALAIHLPVRAADGHRRLHEMWAVCFDPYHEKAYPLMIKVAEIEGIIG